MDARAIIETLRDGGEPTQAQMTWFANGLATGAVTDAQAGAFAMAVCLRGLSEEARVALTLAMRDSGDVLEWKLKTPVVDKHSTGGIGDCVSLLLAPMLAAVGVANPMISGRGLGHTGGTLDKLEAIPGVATDVDETAFRRMVDDIGCAIVSASKRIAPADKRLYAVRDVTGTVESIDLITASILSKKLAAGLGSLILDVKCGSGAFMKTREDAVALARSLVSTANGAGCRTAALVTAMDQPLASTAGNALEVAEVMQALTNPRNSRLVDLTLALGAELMLLAGVDVSPEVAAGKLLDTLKSGKAARKFDAMIEALGGPGTLQRGLAEPPARSQRHPRDRCTTGWEDRSAGRSCHRACRCAPWRRTVARRRQDRRLGRLLGHSSPRLRSVQGSARRATSCRRRERQRRRPSVRILPR